jgi:hypothetical protein
MATYSLSITGSGSHNAFLPKALQIDDKYAISPGAEQQAMMLGMPVLCLQADGSQVYHRFEAERCIPGVLRIMRKV